MAAGYLKKLAPAWDIYSAGTHPESEVNRFAIQVMQESGIEIGQNIPRSVHLFTDQTWDAVITLCSDAENICHQIPFQTNKRIHFAFDDPANARGSAEEILNTYRRVRDQMILQINLWHLDWDRSVTK
jgi:arsenate reductase